jgi:hypothetical protein
MRPTFSRFDINDLLDTLPPFVRHPMALATMASVLAHGVVAVGLPVFAGSEEKKPERVVDVISLSPAEQAKLPSNSLMMPGGGLNGTSALPLPLTKNGALSPLAGLPGSTLGGSGSGLMLDLPQNPVFSQSSSSTNNDFNRRTVTITKPLFPPTNFTGKRQQLNIDFNATPEQEPSDHTNREQTPQPPGAPAANLPDLKANQGNSQQTQTPQQVASNTPGVAEDAGKTQQQGQQPSLTLPKSGDILGARSDEDTKTVDPSIFSAAGAKTFGDLLGGIANQTDEKPDKVFESSTMFKPQLLEIDLPLPKTSDAPAELPYAAEVLVLLTPQGTLYTEPKEGKLALKSVTLRKTGYTNPNQAVSDYLANKLPDLQERVNQKIKARELQQFEKYSYLKIIFKPKTVTADT